MRLAAGFGLLMLGLAGRLVLAHLKSLRYFDRPRMARARDFDACLGAFGAAAAIAGLALIAAASAVAASATAAILLALWIYRRVVRSVPFQARLLRRDFASLRRARPDAPDAVLLFEVAFRRHPRWGRELIEQMVEDYPTIDRFSVVVARMERGFRGFGGGRRPSR